MSSSTEAKDSLLEGDGGGKNKVKDNKDIKATGHDNTLLPLDELEKELVSEQVPKLYVCVCVYYGLLYVLCFSALAITGY